MPVEGRGLSSRRTQQVARDRGLGNLSTPKIVQKLQTALHAKAKAEAGYRFYALYDKISRDDILAHAYAQCRSNKGAPGVDGQEFADIEAYGVKRWLSELAAFASSKAPVASNNPTRVQRPAADMSAPFNSSTSCKRATRVSAQSARLKAKRLGRSAWGARPLLSRSANFQFRS